MKPGIQSESNIRLNRFLAEAGVCSRREADARIFNREVTVNGQLVTVPAFRIDPQKDAVKVSGRRVRLQPWIYILLNKPAGVIATVADPEKRTTVIDLLKGVRTRVYPVGRLDFNTSGVLLLTNDGDLALRLMHPRYGFTKTYHAQVRGVPTFLSLQKMKRGVRIDVWSGRYEKTLPAQVHLVKKFRKGAIIEITLREGRQHQVKKMCAAIGHPVEKLVRVKFGFLTAAGLPLGAWRYLTPEEIKKIRDFKPEPLVPLLAANGRPKEKSFRPTQQQKRNPRF